MSCLSPKEPSAGSQGALPRESHGRRRHQRDRRAELFLELVGLGQHDDARKLTRRRPLPDADALMVGASNVSWLAAVQVTSLLRGHLSQSAWRRVHLLGYALFATTTVHALMAGTEATRQAGSARRSRVDA